MNQVQTPPAAPSIPRTGALFRGIVIALLVGTVFGASLLIVEGPQFVDRVTVVNQSDLELDVDTAAPGGGWTPAGVALPDGVSSFHDVIDHGDAWAFRVSNGGHDMVFRVSRHQLQRSGWRVTVPASVQADLDVDAATP